MRVRLRGVSEDVDRHGNVRVYFRPKDKPKVRLREPFGSAAFMEEYKCAEAGVPYEAASPAKPKKRAPAKANTLEHLCQQYYVRGASSVSADTMYRRRRILEKVCAIYGQAPFTDVTPRELASIRDELAATNGARNNIVKAVGALFAWAKEAHITDFNPAHGIRRLHSGNGFHAWNVGEVRAFVKRHPPGTKPHRALVFFLFTGLRVSDVARLSWENVTDDGRVHLVPSKTSKSSGAVVDIPILPALAVEIGKTPPGQETFMLTDHGKPYSVKSFGMKFARWCEQAGIGHCSAHGLRKIGATIAAELGASEHQLMAIYGWTTQEQAAHYTKTVNRRRLSDQGMSLLTDAWTEVLSVPLLPDHDISET